MPGEPILVGDPYDWMPEGFPSGGQGYVLLLSAMRVRIPTWAIVRHHNDWFLTPDCCIEDQPLPSGSIGNCAMNWCYGGGEAFLCNDPSAPTGSKLGPDADISLQLPTRKILLRLPPGSEVVEDDICVNLTLVPDDPMTTPCDPGEL